MKILVTGSAGFIGYHLCSSLLKDGFDVLGVDNINDYYDVNLKIDRTKQLSLNDNFRFESIDISQKESLSKVFDSFEPVKVVNLAAQAGVRYSITNPHTYMNSNLVGFLNIIELCRHRNVEGLIYASSSSVYGGNKKMPFSELDKIDNPISLYAVTKKSNELIANAYSHLYDLNTTGLRFFTVYGPWGRPDMAMFIFTKKILAGDEIQVYNNGKMQRDFTFIDDIISGVRKAVDKNYKCEIFNLGNNKSEKLMDMIAIIERELNLSAKINFMPLQPGDVPNSYADIKKSKKMLSFNPKTNIDVGIVKFIEWYKRYYNI